MHIPFNDLSRQYLTIKQEIDEAIKKVVSRGVYILSDEVSTLEREFAAYIGVPHAIGVGCGTDALTLALRALDIGKGDEVILPANAYPTVFGVASTGVTIKLVDVGLDGNMDMSKLSKSMTKRTKAIIPVHLYGSPAEVYGIQNILKRYSQKIYVIEDCAQAHGAEIQCPISNAQSSNRKGTKYSKCMYHKVGSIGDIGCFSFYPTKNLGAYGDGGMIVTHNPEIAMRIRRLRMYGETSRYSSVELSGISRLDELQAAVLRVKLKHLDAWNRKRKDIAAQYIHALQTISGLDMVTGGSIPEVHKSQRIRSVFHLFVIRTKKRDALKAYLEKQGIGTAIHYPHPIHLTPSCSYLGYGKGDFPVSEMLSREVLSIPLYPELTEKETVHIIQHLKSFL